jgi:peptidoglycan glycosyltransferase
LPFISYGGSSLLVNAVVVGLLLALSDKGVEPPPRPTASPSWRDRLRPGGRAARHLMLATSSRRRPLGRTIVHVALVLALAFGVLAGAGGYWAVIRSTELSDSPYDPAVHRRQPDGPARRHHRPRGNVLTHNEKDANGELYGATAATRSATSIGYASPRYGRVGLELAYDAEAVGSGGRPAGRRVAQVRHDPYDPKDLHLSMSWDLQRAAVRALGSRRGAVVMLDPRNGRGPRARVDPDIRRLGHHEPEDLPASIRGAPGRSGPALLPRATLGRYVPGSVFKIVTAIAGLGSGADHPRDDLCEAAAGRRGRAARGGLPDP